MTNLETLYDRIETDYWGMREEWREYEFDELMSVVENIAKYKSIYNYIMGNRPITEEQAEHFLAMDNPFLFICNQYNLLGSERHEEYQTVINDIYDHKLTDMKDTPCFAELKWKIFKLWEEYQRLTVVYVDEVDIRNVIEGMSDSDFTIDEYDSKQLMQFKNPLLALALETGRSDEPFKNQVEQAIKVFENVDLLTYKFELEKENILPETKQRHDAIVELMSIVPDFHFQTAMRWLDLNRAINECMLEGNGEDNPYQDFLKTMRDIKEEHGTDLLQKVFDMGAEIVIQPIELVEIAKYLADGGDVNMVSELADEDYFLVPYEEHKQGGMNLC